MNHSVTVEATENQKAKGKKTNDISYCLNIGSYIYIYFAGRKVGGRGRTSVTDSCELI